MGFSKSWNAQISFTPALTEENLKCILGYIGKSDYSTIDEWSKLPVSKRTRDNEDTWGCGRMHQRFQNVLKDYKNPVSVVSWDDERNGGSTPYTCQDIAKLLRICRKLGIKASGSVSGEGFAYIGDMYFIIDNTIRAPVVTPGDVVFQDDYESDDETDRPSKVSKSE